MNNEMTPEQELALLRQRREERETRESAEAKARAARLVTANEIAIEKALAEHGEEGVDFGRVTTVYGVVLFKRAERLAWKRFVSKGAKVTDDDMDVLARSCLIHPSRDEYASLVERLPAIPMRCADVIATLAGVQSEEAAKK